MSVERTMMYSWKAAVAAVACNYWLLWGIVAYCTLLGFPGRKLKWVEIVYMKPDIAVSYQFGVLFVCVLIAAILFGV